MPDGGSLLLPLRVFVEDPFPSTLPQSIDQRFSTKLSELLPDFVVEDHPTFVAFVRHILSGQSSLVILEPKRFVSQVIMIWTIQLIHFYHTSKAHISMIFQRVLRVMLMKEA